MTRPLTALALIALIQISAHAQSSDAIAGHWEGEIEIPGQPLRIKVDLTHEGDAWAGTIDIPDQAAHGIALEKISVDSVDGETQVAFTMSGVPGEPSFDGRLGEDGDLRGTFSQGPARLSFRLGRGELAGPVRPQEPKEPFPYASEEARFSNGEVRLAGTLTVPEGNGPFPAVLLISGSGPQDRNEELFGHKPFWVLADHLSRAGIAVLRVDDPGVGQSSPHPQPATSADFADDVDAGVAYLKGDSRIDHARIGLAGHSEGGTIATLVASRNEDVGFVVLLAGPGVRGDALMRKQNERIYDASGIRGKRRETLLRLLDELFAALTSDMDDDSVREVVAEVVRGQFEANGVPRKQQDETQIQLAVEPALSPWMRYFLSYDPGPAIAATKVPVLALNGERDLQVDAEQNLGAIESILREAGNDDVTIHRLAELNHLFQHARTGLVNEYGIIEETMSREVLDIVRDWILQR